MRDPSKPAVLDDLKSMLPFALLIGMLPAAVMIALGGFGAYPVGFLSLHFNGNIPTHLL